MRASTVNLYRPSKEMIDENVKNSASKDRILMIKQAQDNLNGYKRDHKGAAMRRKTHALSDIDDHLFQQSLNDLVG